MTQTTLKPPGWLIACTVVFTLLILMMAVAETTLWTHFLIDQGEYVSLAGLVFISGAGFYLYKQQRLWASLPLMLPWLIYPVVTQGDQIIDNLSINQMRLVVHLILAVLFGAPVAVLILAARHFMNFRRSTELALLLLLCEAWVAQQYLGSLMVITLVMMGAGVFLASNTGATGRAFSGLDTNRIAFKALIAGLVLSLGLYVVFKNRPGAYQGSPHFYHDPSQKAAVYEISNIQIPSGVVAPADAELAAGVHSILAKYGTALKTMSHGYYILDRNYNYAFHNALFLRHTPLLPDFRSRGLAEISRARESARDADEEFESIRAPLASYGSLSALLNEVRSYVSYSLDRAAMLEEITARFEQTQAGLQHATHVYEGEGKILGVVLKQIVEKHWATLTRQDVRSVASSFVTDSEEVYQAYANRIVGF